MAWINKTNLPYLWGKIVGKIPNPNLLINGDFQVWQRGSSITTASGTAYTADRWSMWNGSGNTTVTSTDFNLQWTCGGNDNLIQIVEMPTRIVNKALTLTVSFNVPTGKSVSVHVAGATSATVGDSGFVANYVGIGTWERKTYYIVTGKQIGRAHV